MLSVSHGHASLIELKLFSRDVYSPVDHGHEVALQLIDILERYSANRCDVAIGVESVVLHFRCHKHCDQNQSMNRKAVYENWMPTECGSLAQTLNEQKNARGL